MGKDLRFSRDELLDDYDDTKDANKHHDTYRNVSQSKRKKEKRLSHSLHSKRQQRHDTH
ncbi:hypothetical protein [Agaribacter flavus]|uniref:Uncharacterized protein n=1 Tax=Agaribacter flavus TaxID=1902781 RepID=A0ABV7FSP1_9ALTE